MPLLCALLILVIALGVAVNSKGRLRWISVSVIALIGLPLAAFGLWLAAMGMEVAGIWPFDPLASYHRERTLENGGILVFDEKESRSVRKASSFTDTIGYLAPGSHDVEPIASETRESWGAWNLDDVKTYFSGDLVIVVTPGATDFFVRPHPARSEQPPEGSPAIPGERSAVHSIPSAPSLPTDERWRRLSLHYFHGAETAFSSTFAGNSQELLLKTRAEIMAKEGHEPSVQIAYFNPAARELAIAFDAGKMRSHHVLLELSEDGTRLGPGGYRLGNLPALATDEP